MFHNFWIIDFLFVFYIKNFYLSVYLLFSIYCSVSISREWTMSNFLLKQKLKKFFKIFWKTFSKKKNSKNPRKISGKQTNSKFLKFFWRYYQLQCLSYFWNFFHQIWMKFYFCVIIWKRYVYGFLLHPLLRKLIGALRKGKKKM